MADESDGEMWGEIEYENMEWQHRKDYFNILSDDLELEREFAKDVQPREIHELSDIMRKEKGAKMVNGKNKHQPINKKQLQASMRKKR
jgi:hypothetical protein